MQHGMVACVCKASRAIQYQRGRRAEDVARGQPFKGMPDRVGRIRVDRYDLKALSTADLHPTLIGRLAATAGIEAGAVERDTSVTDVDDSRLGLEAIVILQIQGRSALCRGALVPVHR